MIFDLHIHQEANSNDSKLNIEEVIKDAKAVGLDGVCITDHDDLGLRPYAEELSRKYDLTIIVGVEIFTLDGDLLCYGIDEMPKERMSAKDTIDFVHKRGGICIAAHPYRHNNRGLKDLITTLNLDAVEAFNGRTDAYSNQKALEFSLLQGLPVTGGSDAHSVGEIGNFATQFDQPIACEADFIAAVKSKHFRPISLTGLNTKKQKLA